MSNASHVLFSLGCQIDLRTSKATSSTVQYFIARVDYCFSGSHKSQVTFPLPLLVPPRPRRREILSLRNHRHGCRDAFLHAAPSLLAVGARPLPPYLIRSPSHLPTTVRSTRATLAAAPCSRQIRLRVADPPWETAAVARRAATRSRMASDGGGSSATATLSEVLLQAAPASGRRERGSGGADSARAVGPQLCSHGAVAVFPYRWLSLLLRLFSGGVGRWKLASSGSSIRRRRAVESRRRRTIVGPPTTRNA